MWPGFKKPPFPNTSSNQTNSQPPARPSSQAPQRFPGFIAVAPDPVLAKQEQRGNTSWKGGTLPFIPAEGNLPFVDLPAKLIELVQHCWNAASVSEGAERSGLQIGSGNRQNHIPDKINQLKNSWSPQNIFEAQRVQERNGNYAKQVQPIRPTLDSVIRHNPHLGGTVPTDWKVTEQLERVNAYTFRGDRRNPIAVSGAGGFHPPISRTDAFYVDTVIFPMFQSYMKRRFQLDITRAQFDRAYDQKVAFPQDRMVLSNFFVWRSMVANEAYHLGRMLADQTLKGYISTTRSTSVAKGFANTDGWVYLTLVRGGFLVPDQGKHEWTKIFGEQEIALPCAIPWDEIFAFRQVNNLNMFTGPIYFRQGFSSRNAAAYKQAFELFSGKAQ